MIDISISAVVAYITAVSVVGAVVSLIMDSRRHAAGLDKCLVCGRPKKDNAVYAPGADHPFYYEHCCRTPEGVTTVTSGLYGRESTASFWYDLENGTVLEPLDIGAAIWGSHWVKQDGKVLSREEWHEAHKNPHHA